MAGDTQGVSRDTLFPWGAPPPRWSLGHPGSGCQAFRGPLGLNTPSHQGVPRLQCLWGPWHPHCTPQLGPWKVLNKNMS